MTQDFPPTEQVEKNSFDDFETKKSESILTTLFSDCNEEERKIIDEFSKIQGIRANDAIWAFVKVFFGINRENNSLPQRFSDVLDVKRNELLEAIKQFAVSAVENETQKALSNLSESLMKNSQDFLNQQRKKAWLYGLFVPIACACLGIFFLCLISFIGGAGTGKTTFVNAIINEMKILTPKHRLLILEDTLELQCSMENFVSMRTTSDISMQDLLKITMRQRPDRIIIGEVRGKEALDMLKAWNTGHPGGVCTVHANDARAGLLRIEQLISEVSQNPMRELIAEAIDVVVFLVRDPHIGPKLSELIAVDGVHDGQYAFHDLKEVVA